MKKLQNNFTTPEQSKRLLELGVPADSADMFYAQYSNGEFAPIPGVLVDGISETEYVLNNNLPCWSVGRLIEIYEICTSCLFERRNPELSILEDVMSQISEDIIATDECWDFSKLED